MKMSALRKIGFFFVMLGSFTLPQAAFADSCSCSSSLEIADGTGFPADAIFNKLVNSNTFQVQTAIVGLTQIQAILLHDAILGVLFLPPAVPALLAALQFNAQALANNIVSFNPSQAGTAPALATLFFQYDQLIVALAQNAFSPQATKDLIVANLNSTAAQIAVLIGQILPGVNPTSLIGAYNFYTAALINQVNFFATVQLVPGIQTEIATLGIAATIGAYIGIGELIQQNGVQAVVNGINP